ncbi:MAG: hypothetical protein WA981_16215 [Glaciecola sp.]
MRIQEQLFIVDQQVTGLSAEQGRAHQKNNDVVSTQAMIDAIIQPELAQSRALLPRVNHSIRLFRRYKTLLLTLSSMQAPALAAASSETESVYREGEGFTLQSHKDSLHSHLMFVVLTLQNKCSDTNSQPVVLHIEYEQCFSVLSFDGPKDSASQKYQVLLDTSSDAYKALTATNSCLYLQS